MMKRAIFLSVIFLGFVALFAPLLSGVVIAQDFEGGESSADGLTNPWGEGSTIPGVLDNIIEFLRDYIAPPIVAIMVIFGGFQMLFAQGDPERFSTGKKTILYAVVGYIIIIVASGISSLIESILSG